MRFYFFRSARPTVIRCCRIQAVCSDRRRLFGCGLTYLYMYIASDKSISIVSGCFLSARRIRRSNSCLLRWSNAGCWKILIAWRSRYSISNCHLRSGPQDRLWTLPLSGIRVLHLWCCFCSITRFTIFQKMQPLLWFCSLEVLFSFCLF